MRIQSLAVLIATWTGSLGAQGRSPIGLRADLEVFRGQFMASEQSYAPAARTQAESALAVLEKAIDTMSLSAFALGLGRIVALADNGHTNMFWGLVAHHFNRVPVRLAPLGEDFYVMRAGPHHLDLLGGRLTSIDGHPVSALRAKAHELTGGSIGRRDWSVPALVESPEHLHALGLAKQAGAAVYTFERLGGGRIERRLVAEPPRPNAPRATPNRLFYPDAEVPEPEGWRGLLPHDRAPWALQDVTLPFRRREAPELQALVIELRQNRDAPGRRLGAFLDSVEVELGRLRPRNVVLDMRMNGGGDLNTTRDFMRKLPGLVPGRVFVLTSSWTFSAAISSVGYLEQEAPDRVTIVGEMVGDRLEFWAEGGPVRLPNTGLILGRSTERHDYATGCKPFRDCHGAVVRHPISVKSLAPDIPAPWTLEAYRAGRDPAIEAVAAAVR